MRSKSSKHNLLLGKDTKLYQLFGAKSSFGPVSICSYKYSQELSTRLKTADKKLLHLQYSIWIEIYVPHPTPPHTGKGHYWHFYPAQQMRKMHVFLPH